MLNLRVSEQTLASRLPDGPAPIFAAVSDSSGTGTGELLVCGRLTALEYAWWTENPPTSLPSVDQVHLRRTGVNRL